MEFLDGVFTHLALVDNPRYEKALVVLNSKTEKVNAQTKENKMEINNGWVTMKDKEGEPYHVKLDEEETDKEEKTGEKKTDKPKEKKETGKNEFKSNFQDIKNLVGTIKTDDKFFDSKYDIAEKRLKDRITVWEKELEEIPEDKKFLKPQKEKILEIAKDELKELQKLKHLEQTKQTKEEPQQLKLLNSIIAEALTEAITENCLGE